MEITQDSLLGGRLQFLQPARGYRAAIDPVFLAASLDITHGQRLLELGCGTGVASLCLLTRFPECQVTGLEINPDYAALAGRNASLNHLNQFEVVEGDVSALPAELRQGFDQVFCNPPFYARGRHSVSPDSGKALAHGGETPLVDWVKASRQALRGQGSATFIWPVERLDDIIVLLTPHFGDMRLFPMWPKTGVAAKRMLIQARLGRKSPTRLLPGIVLHEADGSYTPAAQAVLAGAALIL